MLPPTYFIALLILEPFLCLILPYKILGWPLALVGIVPMAFGAVLNIWTDLIFKRAGTTVKPGENPSRLITWGPFRISRHPMYLGMAAILFGEAILLGSAFTLLAPSVFIAIMELRFIPLEEGNLEKAFRSSYGAYRTRVRRWL